MALKIFGDDPANLPKPRTSYVDDVVGRFRSGYTVDGEPAPLTAWRVTTSDAEVAATIAKLFDGSEPEPWDTKGDDDIEVFTDAASVDIIIDGPRALRERMVYFRDNELVYASDGEFILDEHGKPTDERDPDASLTYQERKAKGEAGTGPVPDTDLYFRLAAAPELGIFLFKSPSFSLAYDLARNSIAERIAAADGPVEASFSLKEVSFKSRTGESKGQTVTYTATRIELKAASE